MHRILKERRQMIATEFAEICIRVLTAHAEKVVAVLADILAIVEGTFSFGGKEAEESLQSA